MTALGVLWFVLVAVLIVGYFALDGFDLGCGVLYPFIARTERERSQVRRAVGPVWDGNEVWLLTAGGALFAAFAPAYATSFSGFYLAIMLVLFGLILRAAALEFRAHETGTLARFWDVMFFVGSLLPALLFGVAIGNVLKGIELNVAGDYTGGFFALLNPFSLLCGVLGLVHMLLLGASWLALKAPEGDLRQRALRLRRVFALADLAVFALTSLLFFVQVVPASAAGVSANLVSCLFALVFVAATAGVACLRGAERRSNLVSQVLASLGCVGLVGAVAASLFPNLIPATDPYFSITIANAASTDTSLAAMTIIACIGVPLVLVYHVIAYRIFNGELSDADLTY